MKVEQKEPPGYIVQAVFEEGSMKFMETNRKRAVSLTVCGHRLETPAYIELPDKPYPWWYCGKHYRPYPDYASTRCPCEANFPIARPMEPTPSHYSPTRPQLLKHITFANVNERKHRLGEPYLENVRNFWIGQCEECFRILWMDTD